MYYGSTTEATDWDAEWMNDWKVKIIKTILFFIPQANPDHEKLYPSVAKWLLEIDDEGFAEREIALDKDGKVLFCSPDDRNTGMWTDMGRTQFSENDLSPITKEYFDNLWHEKKYT